MPENNSGASGYAFVAIVGFITWIALIFSPGITMEAFMQEVFVGAVVALTVAGLTYRYLPGASMKYFHPRRLGYLMVYTFVFIWEMIKANIHMMIIVLSPKMPLKPGIVKITTDLSSPAAKLMLANSITLTPGTMTMEIKDNTLYIHWVQVCDDLSKAGDIIKGAFEKWLKGVFS
ncbi:MAG: Na+/H+ antiporter subunit E [Euryarchaeota archaeon]|nr:Na+/H+ antiporter subunit E [Euryarchaeota archaeon]